MLDEETQAPPHEINPVSHVKVHALSTHAGCALVTVVEQALPHVLQLFVSLAVSTHFALHSVSPLPQPESGLDREEVQALPLPASLPGGQSPLL